MRRAFRKIMERCRAECKGILIRDFSDLVRKTVGAVLRSMYVPYDSDDISELRNDVFLSLFGDDCKRLKVFDPEKRTFPGWIKLITVQTAIGRLRRKGFLELRNRRYRRDMDDIMGIFNYDENDRFDAREKLNIVQKTIGTMPDRDRQILEEACYRWKSLAELSLEMDISYNTAAKRLHDARKRLKKQVETLFDKE